LQTFPYIAIEGAIGVGKTTLARIFGDALPAAVLFEEFEENPFLSDFYADRARYAFQTQIFFLLSRYRQQHGVIAQALSRGPLVSDYLFAKDWLFAHLNLAGDELAMYQRVHAILGEQIPAPDLVVYLRATTDTLMHRILQRDRSYERQMSRSYIEDLRQAYAAFFEDFSTSPVIILDTDDLDVVNDREARAAAVSRVRSYLTSATYQPRLPQLEADDVASGAAARPGSGQRTAAGYAPGDARGIDTGALLAFAQLAGEVGHIGAGVRRLWIEKEEKTDLGTISAQRAAPIASDQRSMLAAALAGALDCIGRIADHAGLSLELQPRDRD
jgi:deoxyadenosine/deoxycytidine kinase